MKRKAGGAVLCTMAYKARGSHWVDQKTEILESWYPAVSFLLLYPV